MVQSFFEPSSSSYRKRWFCIKNKLDDIYHQTSCWAMEEWMLNDLLECSVCLERLDISSRVLPCQHTFCKKCLEEIVTTHKELRCPECRILVTTKLEDLPPNVLLMRILEGIKNVPKNKQPEDTQVHNNQQSNHDASQNANILVATPQQSQQPQQQVAQPLRPQQIHPEIQQKIETTPKALLPLQQPCAKALYDYTPQEPGDLGFKKGDIIILKKRIDANWYQGERNSCQGFFPASYVQVITPLPCPNATVPQCIALYDFKMSAEDEKDCLTFNKGAVVTVIRRVDENWAEGRLADRIGIFPISFVEMNSAAKHLMKSSMNFQPGPSRSAPALPVANLTNSLNSLSISASTPSTTANTSNNPDSSPSNAANRVVAREKRLSLNVNHQTQQHAQSNRRSADISSRNRNLTVAPSENDTSSSVFSVHSFSREFNDRSFRPTGGASFPSQWSSCLHDTPGPLHRSVSVQTAESWRAGVAQRGAVHCQREVPRWLVQRLQRPDAKGWRFSRQLRAGRPLSAASVDHTAHASCCDSE